MSRNQYEQFEVLCANKHHECQAKLEIYSVRDSLVRALKTGAMVALAALCTIIIPGVHFLSVPLGLISSPIIATVVFFKNKGQIKGLSANFMCPNCQKENDFAYQEGRPPYFGSCIACKNPYQIISVSKRTTP
ncbi:MAG: hypothetical protein NTX25_19200 [Proteobacteria bacterium]|nr:hypothetical protein [Pseudomonadota bacterium]